MLADEEIIKIKNKSQESFSNRFLYLKLKFYPVTPGVDQYVIGSPLFKKVTLSLQNGKQFVISAPNNTRDNIYINAASLNGQNWNKSYIDFESIQAGGKIEFQMSEQPNLNWANKKEHVPYSLSRTE